MDYHFTKINIINELSKDAKACRKRVIEKYQRNNKFLKNCTRAFCFLFSSLTCGILYCTLNENKFKIYSILLAIYVFLMIFLLLFFIIYEELFNYLRLIDTTRKTKKRIELMEIQMELENKFVLLANSNYNPIGFEIISRSFEVFRLMDDIYIIFTYVCKNLINLDIVERQLEFKILEVVKNCSVIVPTLDITNAKLLLPSDENGNILEEQESQSVDTN